MRFIQHYSGSSGNLYEVVANSGKRLLIDPGMPWAKLQKALNYDLKGIVACLVTHEHDDHSHAVPDIIKAGIDVHMSPGTHRKLQLDSRRAFVFGEKRIMYQFGMGEFLVAPFEAKHDAEDPFFYIIKCDGEYLLFATDTSHIVQKFSKIPFSIIAIECSYDRDILQDRVDRKDINETLAKRLLSSHMEKSNCIKYLADCCDLSQCREIHLLHCSADNLDKEQARKEIEERFFITTRII